MSAYYEPGRYWVQITDHGLTESKTKKTPQFFVKFLVLGPVNHEDPNKWNEGLEQYERTAYRAITTKTKDWVRQDLTTLGFEGSLERFSQGEVLRDKMVTMSCDQRIYNDEAREDWSIPSEAAEIARMDTRAVVKLDKLLGITGKAKSAGTQGTAASVSQAVDPASPGNQTAEPKTEPEPEAPTPQPVDGAAIPKDKIPF